MSLFKKISETVSKGVSTATEKAQQTVELTRLHAQIASKRKEIDKLYASIGEIIYAAYEEENFAASEPQVTPICKVITSIRGEISALDDRVKELRNEKDCSCGRRVPYDTRFCPACGNRFPEPVTIVASEPDIEAEELQPEAVGEEEKTPVEPIVCFGCGSDVEPDARFCPSCGHPADRFS